MNRNIVIVITLVACLLLAGWIIIFPLLMHKDDVRAELINSFAAATGMQLDIQGDVALKAFPAPHLSINSLDVTAPVGSKEPFLITIKDVEVWPVFTSLFSKVVIKKVQVSGVEVNIQEMADGKANWQYASTYWQNGAFQPGSVKTQNDAMHDISFQLSDARVNYILKSGTSFSLENFGTSWTTEKSQQAGSFEVHFKFHDRPVAIAARIGGGLAQLLSQDNVSTDLSITSGKDSLNYKGTAGYKSDRVVLNGDLDVAVEDIAYWSHVLQGQVTDAAVSADYKMLPVSMKTKIVTQDDKMTFSDVALDGGIIKGNARVDIGFPSRVSIKAAIKTLNLQDIVDNGLFNTDTVAPTSSEQKSVYVKPKNTDVWEISSDVKIDDILYNTRHITATSFSAETTGDEITIPELRANIPGDGRVDFSGIGRVIPEGTTLEGQIDVQGANFIQAIGIIETAGLSLPPEDFKRFHVRANLNIVPGEIKLSDLAARTENTSIVGGMIAKFGKRTDLHAAFGVTGLNLDHIAELWGIGNWQKAVATNTMFGKSDGVLSLWLKHLGYNLYINSTLDNYTLGGKLYNKSNLNLTATTNTLEMSSDDLLYGASHISGKVSLDVSKDLPKVDVVATVDKVDASDVFSAFVGGTKAPVAVGTKALWPTDVLDLKWFGFLTAAYNMKFGHLVCDKVEANNVTITGTIADRKLSIDNLTGNFYGSSVSAKLVLDGNSIPVVSGAANVYSLRIERVAELLPLFHGMSGLFNLNLAASSNGVNIQSMMTNLRGSFAAGGRDINVSGFNLPAIVHAVSYVRTVADILGAVKHAFPNGNTVFPVFEGSWVISQGIAETINSKLLSQFADGSVSGKTDLVNWTTNMGTNFALKTLDPANPPVVGVNLSGELENTSIDFDTHLLEQYVNNKTSENMLHQYGGQQ